MALIDQINSLATRVATEFKTVRTEIASTSQGTIYVTSADQTNITSTTGTDVTTLAHSAVASGTYLYSAILICTTALATVGVRPNMVITGTAATTHVYRTTAANSATADVISHNALNGTTAAPGTGAYIYVIDGVARWASTPTSTIKVQIASETGGAVSVLQGSSLWVRKIA